MKKVYQGTRNPDCHFPPGYNSEYMLGDMTLADMWDPLIYGGKYLLKDTPYYKYLEGDKAPMEKYLNDTKGVTWARAAIGQDHLTVKDMFEMFDKIIDSEEDYLEPPYDKHYILARRDGYMIDGLRRACVLLYNGNTSVPVAIVP